MNVDQWPSQVTVREALLPQTLLQGFEQLPAACEFVAGARVGPYRLQRKLGAGGMGVVWLAEQLEPVQRPVALKLVQRRLVGGLAEAYFQVERQALAQMNHPAIARIFDAGALSDGELFFAMEYIDGRTLDAAFATRPGAIEAVVRILQRIAHGVQHAHQKGVIHRDLKPANILVTEIDGQPEPKIIDFGVAIGMSPGVGVARSDGAVGTRAYMAPEQAEPDGTLIDARADVYALGAVLAELLCVVLQLEPTAEHGGLSSQGLRSAFAASLAGARESGERALPSLSTRGLQRIPGELRAVAVKAMAERREQRYASAAAMAEDLGRWLRREPVEAMPQTRRYRTLCFVRRHRLALSACAAVLLALGTGLAAALFGLAEAERGRALAQTERDSARAAEAATRAVKDFVVGVFQGADPELAGRRDLPLSEVLDRGVERLHGSLQAQPATRAELSIILGAVYQNIGQRRRAVDLYDEAIELARAGGRQDLLAEALHRKAWSLYDQEDYAAAQPVVREALALQEAARPGSSAHLASLRLLGLVLSYAGDYSAADPVFDQALSLAGARHGPDSLEMALVQLDLARHLGAAGGRAAEVLANATAAGERFEALLGAAHFRVADALEMRVLGWIQSGQSAPAIPAAAQLVAQRRALYGERSLPHAYALAVQGAVLRRSGRPRDAVPVFAATLAIHEVLDGPAAVSSQVPLHGLALSHEQAGAPTEALAAFRQLVTVGKAHPQNALLPQETLALHLGRNLQRGGALAEAEGLLGDALSRAGPEPSALQAELRLELAAIARQRRDAATAERHLQAVPSAWREQNPLWYAEFVQLALLQGRLTEARVALDRALQLAAAEGADALSTWLVKIGEVQWLRASGNVREAQALAAAIRQRLAPQLHPGGWWDRQLAEPTGS